MNLNDIIPALLGRPTPTKVFNPNQMFGGKIVLVTGAGGSIGSEVCVQLIASGVAKLLMVDHSEYNLYMIDSRLREAPHLSSVVPLLGSAADPQFLSKVFRTFKVDAVVHAAAYKHVPMVERNPLIGMRNNFLGTDILAQCASDSHVPDFLLVSTDKAVNPTNVMGASKRLAEWACLSRNTTTDCRTKFRVVRFGNVMGSSGSVIPLFKTQLETSKAVTITHPDVTRYFMSVQEAVTLVLQSFGMGDGIYVFDMGEPVNICQMAARLSKELGIEDYEIKFVGLRPGEKLYEELTLGDGLASTSHPSIKKAHEPILEMPELKDIVRRVMEVFSNGNVGALRSLLQDIVPGYDPMCGIVDDVWLEENVYSAIDRIDDCFKNTEQA